METLANNKNKTINAENATFLHNSKSAMTTAQQSNQWNIKNW